MDSQTNIETAVGLLQELGLKEYEAKCFVALTRFSTATAKDVSDSSDVPRTRVYDAIRVLESKGLVEVQHSNPKRYRATSIDEAITTLQNEYADRMNRLREALRDIDPVEEDGETEVTHEVWALTGSDAIANRVRELLTDADSEVVFVVGTADLLDEDLVDTLQAVEQRGVSVILGTPTESVKAAVANRLPDVEVFVSGLEWLASSGTVPGDDTEISRLLLVDRETLLVSSYQETDRGTRTDERAVFGRGFANGLVTIVRRLMATGLLPTEDAENGR